MSVPVAATAISRSRLAPAIAASLTRALLVMTMSASAMRAATSSGRLRSKTRQPVREGRRPKPRLRRNRFAVEEDDLDRLAVWRRHRMPALPSVEGGDDHDLDEVHGTREARLHGGPRRRVAG